MKFLSRAELEQTSQSRKDGIDAESEQKLRKTYVNFIRQLVQELKLQPWTMTTSTVLLHRFFTLRSMRKNDRFIMAAGSVFLACKVDESPRALRDVAFVYFKTKSANKPEELEKLRLHPEQTLQPVMDTLLLAERALLYTLSFDLNVDHPFTYLGKAMKDRLGVDVRQQPHQKFFQTTTNILNDSLATTVCLQYAAAKVAYAAMHQVICLTSYKLPLPEGQTFCEYFEITQAEIDDIVPQFMSLYAKKHTKGTAGGAAGTGGHEAGGAAAATVGAAAPAVAPVPAPKAGPPMPSFRPIVLQDNGEMQPAACPASVAGVAGVGPAGAPGPSSTAAALASVTAEVEEGELPSASADAPAAAVGRSGGGVAAKGSAGVAPPSSSGSGSGAHRGGGSGPVGVSTPALQNGGGAGPSGHGGPRSPLADSDGEEGGIGHAPGSGDQNNHNEPDAGGLPGRDGGAGAEAATTAASRKRTRSPGGMEEGEISGLPGAKSPCVRAA